MLQQFFSHANWLAIGVAALSYYALGALWFSVLFGKPWAAAHGIQMPINDADKAKMRKQMPKLMVVTLLMNIVVALGVGLVIYATSTHDCVHGIKWGLLLSVFAAVPMCMGHMYTMKKMSLWFIDGAYHTIAITLMSIIISVWHH
ncbi:MAG TPA: DUF1761 domain-containing protein [Bacteroidia bacterium]|jgi:hypothetical protein|nr:DUF1761 domain-containing protein [Bacteroidia bacterium]